MRRNARRAAKGRVAFTTIATTLAGFALGCATYSQSKAADIQIYDTGTMSIEGRISKSDAEFFGKQIALMQREWTNQGWITLYLNSPGGNLDEAYAIAQMMKLSGWKIITRIEGSCYSACALVFAAGDARQVGASSKLGVHQASVPAENMVEVDENVTVGEFLKANEEANTDMSAMMTRLGVPSTIVRWAELTAPTDIHIVTPAEAQGWASFEVQL